TRPRRELFRPITHFARNRSERQENAMQPPKSTTVLINLLLVMPALLLVTAGISYVAFGLEGANHLLDRVMSTLPGKVFLSPVVVVGGPLLVVLLNTWQLCHL